MKRQLDLLQPSGLGLKPESGRSEPRLWVRRLVLWKEPGDKLRDIELRPGLNIIWSPDPADSHNSTTEKSSLGHGSGKSLFCRLIRYCLGEDRFAPDEQRSHIAQAFPTGEVGAEVVLDGIAWTIFRPIGMTRHHYAIPGGDFDSIIAGEVKPTGIEPFLEAIETGILSDEVADLIPGDRPLRGWLSALAWLARDQECRFAHPLQWRSPTSKSISPVRSLSETKILEALRILIGAMTPEECRLQEELSLLDRRQKMIGQEIGHREWSTIKTKSRLISQLGLRNDEVPAGELAVDLLRKAAKENLARAAKVNPETDVSDLDVLREKVETAKQHATGLNNELIEVNSQIPEIERLVSKMRGEIPGLSFSADLAEHPQCPICEVPIDHALDHGCKLSHHLHNAEEIRARRERLKEEIRQDENRLQNLKMRQGPLVDAVATARRHADELRQQLRVVERLGDVRAAAWYSARRMLDEVGQWNESLGDLEDAQISAGKLSKNMEEKRDQAAALRNEQAKVFRRLSHFFNVIIREVAGSGAEGKITLDGNGLHLSVELGGDRSTPAIDLLKVIAFDLAALCMSMEGRTHVPAFLIHDSPREADLGLSIYHHLFHFAQKLEVMGERPLFQYIVTTTTCPPEELSKKPWLRETLGGAPAEARLLKRDL